MSVDLELRNMSMSSMSYPDNLASTLIFAVKCISYNSCRIVSVDFEEGHAKIQYLKSMLSIAERTVGLVPKFGVSVFANGDIGRSRSITSDEIYALLQPLSNNITLVRGETRVGLSGNSFNFHYVNSTLPLVTTISFSNITSVKRNSTKLHVKV